MNNMRRIYLLFFFLCLFTACSKVEWVTTDEGLSFYGKGHSSRTYSWSGDSFGGVIHGPGTLYSYNKRGNIIDKQTITAVYGATSGSYYTTTQNGKYIGSGKNKKGLKVPKGFGVLMGDFQDAESATKHTMLYIGNFRKGAFSDFGQLYVDEQISYEGYWKAGKKDAIGKEYINGNLVYDGSFKSGLRHGHGDEYAFDSEKNKIYLKYRGEWKKGLYDGFGSLYNENILVYEGSWKSGLYDGKGKLYENGQCIDGKWQAGMNTKMFQKSIVSRFKTYFGYEDQDGQSIQYTDLQLAENVDEFILELKRELDAKIQDVISTNVDKRFGFWGVFRTYYQTIFMSKYKRIKKAEKSFSKGLEVEEVVKEIDAKVEYFNNSNSIQLNYVQVPSDSPKMSIVTTEVAMKVLERESMEVTDSLIGIIVDIILCFVVAFIIGFIIGFFFPSLIPYCGIVDIVMGILAFIGAMIILFVYGGPVMQEMEMEIKQMLVYNYTLYLDSLGLIQQIIS